ncbi:MAG: hypothetical protein QF404_06900 [Planctomycetota bacterium]|jgi:hypothetical protein|nr:hypothetical protein [Planctomycetota bacterium]MDP6938681.1 hypothetical protein [Planctomycetota bacterium]
MMRGVGLLVVVLECACCVAPRTHFQQSRLVVGAREAQWATDGPTGASVLRPVVLGAAFTLVWEPLEVDGILEGLTLGEVDAGLIREQDWEASAAAATWIEISTNRNGYRLLVGKGAGNSDWITRWDSVPGKGGRRAAPESTSTD